MLHVAVGGDIGGAERLLVDLATRSEASGADHTIALITPNPALERFFRDHDLDVEARIVAGEGPVDFVRRAFGSSDVDWVAALLRDRGSHIVHTHTLGSHVLGTRAAQRTGRPQLRTEHHVVHYFDPSAALFTRWAAARTNRFVAISEYVRRVICATAPQVSTRMHVVRNGVDLGHWAKAEQPEGEFRLAIVCRLTRWKRVHLAIQAAALAGVPLTVVGDGEEREALEALARRLGAPVTFVGHTDPRPYVRGSDATLSTADHEPLGLSVLESLSMGRPVIAYAGGGILEIVQAGATGWLVEPATAEAFAAAIGDARAHRPRCHEMGERGRAFVVAHASIDHMCRGYAEQYRTLSEST